jgi:phenylalanine-4-hydroxylase
VRSAGVVGAQVPLQGKVLSSLEVDPVGTSKTSLMFTTKDGAGSLKEALGVFERFGVSLSRIESRPSVKGATYDFFVDFEGAASAELLSALHGASLMTESAPAVIVPWFPTRISDIDSFSTKTLDAGADLESDHPGFSDAEYRARRASIVAAASAYRYGSAIPRVEYSAQEVATWGVVYDKLGEYTSRYAVQEFKAVMPYMEYYCGYARNNIPQLEDISQFLRSRTGFSIRPVGGLLTARDFLNALAFRVFFSTQYIRHHTRPLYTPEPDVVHELLGHVPMFADPDFADFSQEIGLASLGASDEEIKKLATCYWFSVEFGLCKQAGSVKAYGAGLLSSFGELEFACSPTRPAGGRDDFPNYLPWDPQIAARTEYPITTFQPTYFVAESLEDAKVKMREYTKGLPRPFGVRYDPTQAIVVVDRKVFRSRYDAQPHPAY